MVSDQKAKHILTVFWVLHDPDSEANRKELVDALEAQRDIPGVLSLRHGPRSQEVDWEGPDKAFNYGMVMTFVDFDSARAYVPHPIHQNLVEAILRLGSAESDIRGFWIDR